jgi:hypothetical protein
MGRDRMATRWADTESCMISSNLARPRAGRRVGRGFMGGTKSFLGRAATSIIRACRSVARLVGGLVFLGSYPNPTFGRPLLVIGSAATLLSCQGPQAERESRAELAVLKREVQGLQELVQAEEAGTLIPPRSLAVGIRQDVVRRLLSAELPQDFVVENRLRIQITSAEVSFQSSQGLITLRGRVMRIDKPDDFADVMCLGSIGAPLVSSEGRLFVRVNLDRFEIPRVAKGGRESGVLRSAVDGLSQEAVDAIGEGLPPLEIPVRLQQQIPVDGISSGPVRIRSGQIPLKATITRVFAMSGRLWFLIDVAVGRWQPLVVDARR